LAISAASTNKRQVAKTIMRYCKGCASVFESATIVADTAIQKRNTPGFSRFIKKPEKKIPARSLFSKSFLPLFLPSVFIADFLRKILYKPSIKRNMLPAVPIIFSCSIADWKSAEKKLHNSTKKISLADTPATKKYPPRWPLFKLCLMMEKYYRAYGNA